MSGVGITKMDRRFGGGLSIRLMYGEHHRGNLLKLANGRWGIYDVRERQLSKLTFLQPAMAHAKFDELYPDGVPA